MANMTTSPKDNASIIKGQPFSVLVSISGEANIKNTVQVTATLPPGITLIKTFPGKVYNNEFSQQLIFQADKSTGKKTIKFTSDSPSKAHADVSYTPTDNPDLNPDTCSLNGAAAYLYDPSPVTLTGQRPTEDNPFVSASINPMLNNNGGPISDYNIPLRTTVPVRIFTEDMTTEFKPYEIDQENSYYYYLIQKTSKAAVNLKIYATQYVRGGFAELETIFNDERYNQKQIIFMTTVSTNISDNLVPPSIEGTLSSSILTKPDQADEFTVLISSYEGATAGSYIIGFTTDDKTKAFKTELFAGQITGEEDGYYKFKAAYSDLYLGANHLSFIAFDQTGMPVRSEYNYIHYDSGVTNGLDPNDSTRTLVAPEVYDQYGQFISKHEPVNIYSIGNKGLEVWLKSDQANNPDTTIATGDNVTVTAYILHCVDTGGTQRHLPITIEKPSVTLEDGYCKVTISADKLINYKVADGYDVGVLTIEYSRLAPKQKSKIFTRSFATVAL